MQEINWAKTWSIIPESGVRVVEQKSKNESKNI